MIYEQYLNHMPKPFQKEGIKFALDHHYHINGMEMGLGKTMQAIAVSIIAMHKALIICPSYLKLDWEDEYNFFAKVPLKIFVCMNSRQLENLDPSGYDVVICNYEQLSNKNMPTLFKWAYMVVPDEVHYLKNIKATRTKAFHQYLYDYPPERFMGLSGTPITGKVPDWYSLLMLCSYNPKNTSGIGLDKVSYWDFASKFCFQRKQSIGDGKSTRVFYGLRNEKGLRKLLRGKYIKRLAKDVLDLKEIHEKIVTVCPEKDDDFKEAYEEFQKTEKLSVNASIKKASAIMLAPYTVDMAVSMLENEAGPLVIFSDHVDPVRLIAEGVMRKLKRVVVREIVGGMSINERKQITDAYKRGEVDLLIGTIPAMAVGLTLVTGNIVIFNDLSYNPAQNAQALKRVHRIGQNKPVFVYYITARGICRKIISKLKEKMKVLREAT